MVSANPGFHEIPAGYGLPWGTPDEEFIPAPLVFEAEMALARADGNANTGLRRAGSAAFRPAATAARNECAEVAAWQPPGVMPNASGAGMEGSGNEEALPAPTGPNSKTETQGKNVAAVFEDEGDTTNNETVEPVPEMPGMSSAIDTTGAYRHRAI